MIDLKNHYGFTRTPFGKDLAPSMLCRYPAHAEAVARITWCARERALGVITGEVGAGKTVAARAAIAALDQTRHTLLYLPDPTTGTRGIHHHVVTALGGRPAHGSAELAAQAAALIAAEHGERGRVPLLVIDEAHLLTHSQLEAVRILTNSEMDAASPLACLLIGQPTLRRMLRLGVLAALDQRIGLRYAMPAMTSEQTAAYITHHLQLALLTELPAGGSRIGGHCGVRLVTFPGHDQTGRLPPGSGRTGRCPDWRAAGDRGPLGALSAG